MLKLYQFSKLERYIFVKKVITIILMLTLMTGLVSCGGKRSGTSSEQTTKGKDETTSLAETGGSNTVESNDTSNQTSAETTKETAETTKDGKDTDTDSETDGESNSEGVTTKPNVTSSQSGSETEPAQTSDGESNETTAPEQPQKSIHFKVDPVNSLDSLNIEQKICFVSEFSMYNSPEMIFVFENMTWKFEIEGKTYTIDPTKIYYERLEGTYYKLKWDLESAGFMPDYGKTYNIKVYGYDNKTKKLIYRGTAEFTANLGKDSSGRIIKDAAIIPFEINGNNPFEFIKVSGTDKVALTLIFRNQSYNLLKSVIITNLTWKLSIGDKDLTFTDYTVNDSGDSLTLKFNVESKGFVPYKGMTYTISGSVLDSSGRELYNLKSKAVIANIVAGMIPDPARVGEFYSFSKVTPISGSWFLDNENYTKLFDGNIETKMYEPARLREPVVFMTEEAIKIKSYSLVTANDNKAYGRLPTGWILYGSNSGEENDWHVIDEREGDLFKEINDFREYNFKVDNAKSYKYYMFVFEGEDIQFSEIRLCI